MTGPAWTARALADSEADERAWTGLFLECFGKSKDAATLRWKYRDNPDGPAVARVAVDADSGAVVGAYAYMPRRFLRDGQPVVLMQASDAMTDAAWRGRRIFTGLDDEVAAAAAEQGVPWAFAYSGRQSFNGFLRNGWELIGHAVQWRLTFRGRPFLDRHGRWGRLAGPFAFAFDKYFGSVTAGRLARVSPLEPWEPLPRFDASVDALFAACAPSRGLVGVRSARWLNWRYVDTPSRRQECFGLRREGRLAGYLVGEWRDGRAWLVDLLAEDPAARQALLLSFALECVRRACEEATALLADHHPAIPDLIALGFRADRRRKPFRDIFPFIVRACGSVSAGPAAAPPEADRDLGRWHLTDGDRDAEHMSA